MQATIVVVEDETAIREMVVGALEQVGFKVLEAENAAEAHDVIQRCPPDLILLDWMLPGISGLDFAKRLKRSDRTRDIPIIMLTARGEEEERLKGFEAGVDDYVNKPFSIRELVARIKAVLNRSQPPSKDAPLEVNGLLLDPIGHHVSANGERFKLGPTEFKLLQFFMSNPEWVFSRTQLLDQVWGTNIVVEERTVDVHIRRLRKALAPGGFDHNVQTVHGTGYRFSRAKS